MVANNQATVGQLVVRGEHTHVLDIHNYTERMIRYYAFGIRSSDAISIPSKDRETTRRLFLSLSMRYVYHS